MSAQDDQDPEPTLGSPSGAPPRDVQEFVGKVSDNIDELELDEAASGELHGHIKTVREQLTSEAPEHTLIDEALDAMRRVLSSSDTQRAAELLAEAGRFLTGVG